MLEGPLSPQRTGRGDWSCKERESKLQRARGRARRTAIDVQVDHQPFESLPALE